MERVAEERPAWSKVGEVPAVVLYRPHLARTFSVAIIVGTLLFAINQLDVVIGGDATVTTWVKVGLTYLVPFCVSNYGVLVATRRPPGSAEQDPL